MSKLEPAKSFMTLRKNSGNWKIDPWWTRRSDKDSHRPRDRLQLHLELQQLLRSLSKVAVHHQLRIQLLRRRRLQWCQPRTLQSRGHLHLDGALREITHHQPP